MPYHGRPSKACHACKARKVKCDEMKPNCQRCTKAGRICPGYRSESELVFRDMTHVAERKVRSRTEPGNHVEAAIPGSASAAPESPLVPIKDISQGRVSSDYVSLGNVLPSIRMQWEDVAVPRLFTDYVLGTKQSRDILSFLPDLCGDPNGPPHLNEALKAVAYINQANQLNLEWQSREAMKCYSRLLALMPKVFQDPVNAKKDTTLATIYLISLYEYISAYKPFGNLWETHHHQGRLSLLRLRLKERDLGTPTKRSLTRITYSQLIQKCLNRHLPPPEEADSWLDMYKATGPPVELAKHTLRVARLCANAQILFDSEIQDKEWRNGLLRELSVGKQLDRDCEQWAEVSKSGIHDYRQLHELPHNLSNAAFQSRAIYLYQDIWTAAVWNDYRSCRIHLHEVLQHCKSLLFSHSSATDLEELDPLPLDSSTIINSLITDICASVPFCLYDVDSDGNPSKVEKRIALAGYLMVWPLHVATVSVELGSEREAWLRGRLDFISNELGIRQARLLARRPRKEKWNLA